ncbi:AsmA family protein, partial [Geminicoccus harenae]
ELATDVIDVARLRPPPAPSITDEPPTPAAPAPDAGPAADSRDRPLNLPTSLPLDLDVAVAAKGIEAPQATFGPTRVRVTSGANFVLLNLVEALAYSGKITGRVNTAADAQGVPRVAIRLSAAGLQVAPLLRDLAQQERLDGRMALNANLTGDARTVRSLMGGLDGTADVTLLNGVVHGFDLSRLSGDPVQVAARLAQGGLSGGSTPFGRAEASFTIANGIARTDDLAAETPLANISGTARLNLGAERIEEMRLIPRPVPGRGGVLGRIPEVPILVSGPFSGPSVSVDADAALDMLAKDPNTVNRVLDQVNKLGGKDGKPLIPEEAGNLLRGLLGRSQ